MIVFAEEVEEDDPQIQESKAPEDPQVREYFKRGAKGAKYV